MSADPFADPWRVQERPLAFDARGLLGLARRRLRWLIGLPVLFGAACLGLSLAFPSYTAETRFAPQEASVDLSSLSGLASQFGFALPSAGGEPPDFYVALARSGEILRSLATTQFSVQRGYEDPELVSGRLIDLLGIDGDTEDERLRAAVDDLKERIRSSVSTKSGLVTVRAASPVPHLSEAVVQRLLELVEDFDRTRQQAQARAEREFIEVRRAEAKADLQAAEDALTAFLTTNRRPEGSALLRLEVERLQRDAVFKQSVYSSLADAFEQARLEEVRNTPVLTIVDRAEGSSRRRLSPALALFIGLVLGSMATVAWTVGEAYLTRAVAGPEGRKEARPGVSVDRHPVPS